MSTESISLPQVFVMLSDSVLETDYKASLSNGRYCLVWHQAGQSWEKSLRAFAYDVVLVDLSLFPEDPVAPLATIRSISPDSEILVLSPSADVTTAVSAFRAGITDYFLKPTSPELISWAIEKCLRKKEFLPTNATLSEDLKVFSAVHHIHTSESENKMREAALNYMVQITRGEGATCVTLSGAAPSTITFGISCGNAADTKRAFEHFRKTNRGVIESSFEDGTTMHPDRWVAGKSVWIPLRSIFLGGIFIHGISVEATSHLLARLEFLTRNLEIAVENLHRHKEVKQLTYIDDVTGLFNSRYLGIALGAGIAEFERTKTPFSVFFIDIDKFKMVNDSSGHLVGSRLLNEVAAALKIHLRKPDLLFRYGGDEFVAIVFDVSGAKALEIAERLRGAVEKKKFFTLGREMSITVSIGVAHFPEHGRDRQTLIQMADDAMYSSKKTGRNRVFVAEPEADKKAA